MLLVNRVVISVNCEWDMTTSGYIYNSGIYMCMLQS